MKRYSAVWWLSMFLKLMAVYVVLSTALDTVFMTERILRATPVFYIMGVPFYISPEISYAVQKFWQIARRLMEAALLLAASDILRMVANTEAYARGTYSLTRKRPAAADSSIDKNRPLPAPPLPVFDNREPTPDDLQYSPPMRHRLQQRLPTSPIRRVTVLRDRAENEERPPRPVGAIEVVDSLDGKPSALPFDKV